MSTLTNEQTVRIPFAGKTVSRCIVDTAFTLEFGEDELLRIEGNFTFQAGDRQYSMSPEDAEHLGPALRLFGRTVTRSSVRRGGQLAMYFTDETNLRVSPDPQYEAWEIVG